MCVCVWGGGGGANILMVIKGGGGGRVRIPGPPAQPARGLKLPKS